MKTQVVEWAPRKGKRVAMEKKWKLENKAEAENLKKKKQRRQEAGTIAKAKEALKEAPNSREEEPKSKLLLIYNLVQSYIFIIIEL